MTNPGDQQPPRCKASAPTNPAIPATEEDQMAAKIEVDHNDDCYSWIAGPCNCADLVETDWSAVAAKAEGHGDNCGLWVNEACDCEYA